MIAWLSTLWGRIAAGAAAVLAIAGAAWLYLARRDARVRRGERDRITAATNARELEDRRIRDEVEADVAGLDAGERRRRLHNRWSRDQDRGL